MRRLLILVAALPIAAFVACSSFDDVESGLPADGGGDATDATSSAADATGDGAAPTDAGANDAAADVNPPGMVLVTTLAGKTFWIDAREVTTGEFTAFKTKVVQLQGGDAGFPAVCSFKGELGPGSSCAGKHPSTAVSCVDWCDAFAYCQAAGKRLCGRIGGGAPLGANEALEPIKSEWMRACTGPNGTNVWPYGDAPDADACNTQERAGAEIFDAGSLPGCVGGEPGLFDMSGNVAELMDTCTGDSGVSDPCYAQGGSFATPLYSSRCADQNSFNRGSSPPDVGFRCCKDP